MKHFLYGILLLLVCCNASTAEQREYTNYHKEASEFVKQNNYNTEFYYLIDMQVHSGKNRFFVYDFNSQKIVSQNLVTHGACDQLENHWDKYRKAYFSNKKDSHCSMKGKFKIGKRDYSSWGIHVKYWLHGLEKSNATAESRVVVLHSWTKVSNTETYPMYSPLSWGCPAVSDLFMQQLDKQLQSSKKPVLLWIID